MQQVLHNGEREGPRWGTSWSGGHLVMVSDVPEDQHVTVQFKSVRGHWIGAGEAYTFHSNGLYTINLVQSLEYRVRCDPGRGARVGVRPLDEDHAVLQEGITLLD